ncbi:membrane metallo-endopeptidase-like 1 [Dermacentor variabilis]|uniref:membrane metallo-endopeptidase-like 1 n=1 Tax=Dermacentor variabilis TaxID=34621 RepID=UPI003F5B5A93
MTSERLKTHVLRSWIDGDTIALRRVGEMTLLATSLFRSCVSGNSLRSVSSDGMAELRALMDQRGLKWPSASASTPPARDLLGMLVDWTLNWNVDVWFSLRVILADTPRHSFTFHVRQSAALQRWSKERAVLEAAEQHEAFVTAYAREFGTSNAEGFDRAVQDVLETEPEIEKFLTDYTPERELAGDGSSQKKIETDAERWRSAVHRSLGPSAHNVSTGNIALISSQGLIAAVAILLSRDAKREKYYSSIGWAVARELGRLVSGSLRELHGMTSTDLLLWCWDRMDKLTSSALVAPFYRSTPLGSAAALSRELFDTLRSSVSLALSENSWMDNRTKQIASSKIATLSLAFGFAKGTFPHVPRVDQPSKSNGNETLFRAWKRATTTYQSLSLEAKASLHSYELLMSNAFFHGDTATVRLQPSLLQMPLYADTLPVSLRYAGLGYVLVHQMMRALSDIFPLLEQDLRDPNLQSHPSIQERNRRVQCLRRFHREASAAPDNTFSSHNYSDWFCDFAAAPHLYAAAFGPPGSGRPSRAQQEERLAGIEELSAEQLFFVGLCSTLCANPNPDSGPSPAEARCNVPLMHMPQFESVFQCAPGLPMTPTTRCSFW